MINKLDETIFNLSFKLQKIKYKAIDEMVEAIMNECGKDYRRELVRKAVVYYFFD